MLARRRIPSLEPLELRDVPATLPAGFTESVAASGLQFASSMDIAPDGKLFITQQSGAMEVWQNGTKLRENFFLNAPLDTTGAEGERGLLGVTFDPNFATNRFVYVYYTTPEANEFKNRVSRFTMLATGPNANLAQAGSEVVVWEGDAHPAGNHNGGAIHFSPIDGKLYIATGDNSNVGNTSATHFSQRLDSRHGKILRINADGSIPTDNPFFGVTTGLNRAIWALGLRNPFTFSFQPGNTGRVFVNDVGQNTWEEINVGVAGSNYGWPGIEGPAGTPPTGPGTYRAPLYAYEHTGPQPSGVAITGGTFYNPPVNKFGPEFLGDYFFSDFGSGWIYRLDFNPGTNSFSPNPVLFATGIGNPVDLDVDAAGNLLYLSIADGAVYQVTRGERPVINTPPPSRTVTLGRATVFSVVASGEGLRYQWQRADAATPNGFANIPGAVNASYGILRTALSDNGDRFRVFVTNDAGSVFSSVATLSVVQNQSPAVNIGVTDGLRNGHFDAGTVINFVGAANDAEDGALPASSYRWRVDYLTTTRFGDPDRDGLPGVTRPFVAEFTGVTGGSFTPATNGPYTLADVAYVIRLSVTDSTGLTTNKVAILTPNTATVTLASNVPGLTLTRDGQPVTAPNSFVGVVGFERVIGAAPTQNAGPIGYQFAGWDDEGAATHTITTPAVNRTYLATYTAVTVNGPVRYESENLGRIGYFREANGSSSGGVLATLQPGRTGLIRGAFQGPSGRYLVQVAYYDENDGVGQLAMKIGGNQIASWALNRNLGSPNAEGRTRLFKYLGLRDLSQGTVFEINGTANGGETAKVDLIIFTRVQGNLERAINAGGSDFGAFGADGSFEGGTAARVAGAVSTAGAADPAPASVYQSWRAGETIRYFLTGLTAGASYAIRLHFSDNVGTAANQSVFDLAINGVNRLDDFDIFAAAGGRFKAVTREINTTADGSGQITLEFTASRGRARVSGIEVYEL